MPSLDDELVAAFATIPACSPNGDIFIADLVDVLHARCRVDHADILQWLSTHYASLPIMFTAAW